MDVSFRSKVDRWSGCMLSLASALCVAAEAHLLLNGSSAAVKVLVSLLVVPTGVLLPLSMLLWPGVRYVLAEDALLIRAGLHYRLRLSLSAIERVQPTTTDWTSQPALSLDRLRIDYRAGARAKRVLVSPVDDALFLDQLAARAPHLGRDGGRLVPLAEGRSRGARAPQLQGQGR